MYIYIHKYVYIHKVETDHHLKIVCFNVIVNIVVPSVMEFDPISLSLSLKMYMWRKIVI